MRGPVGAFCHNCLARPCVYSFGDCMHRDTAVNRANADTEIAADTLFVNDLEMTLTV